MVARNSVPNLVLKAMGCGAYGCLPTAVAREIKNTLELDESRGLFEHVVFAVYAAGPTGNENFAVFGEVFAGGS
jgi:uncharacterized protein (TIGR02452 family)